MATDKPLSVAAFLMLALAIGCSACEQQDPVKHNPKDVRPNQGQPVGGGEVPTAPSGAAKVVETMNSGGYTYVLADVGGKKSWVAGPQGTVAVGDTVVIPAGAVPMVNFPSKTLGRTFDLIYFVGSLEVMGAGAGAGEVATSRKVDAEAEIRKAHEASDAMAKPAEVTAASINKAKDGMSIEEIFKAGASLAGKEVVLRGKVVKYNSGIMGKNWVHVRDGTGGEGTNDLTVTTSDTANIGDTVLVRGKMSADKDFGYGYKFALIIEDAKVTVE